jgi:hypothetical protein
MSNTPVGADFHKSLGVHRYIPTKVPFDPEFPFDHQADTIHLVLGQVLHSDIRTDIGPTEDLPRG